MTTIVIGASPNPERYAYKAACSLKKHGHEVVLLGVKPGNIEGISIHTDRPELKDVHTVTLYLSSQNQLSWQGYIVGLKPRRIIFNPGTENEQLAEMARAESIDTVEACTLVMLSVVNY